MPFSVTPSIDPSAPLPVLSGVHPQQHYSSGVVVRLVIYFGHRRARCLGSFFAFSGGGGNCTYRTARQETKQIHTRYNTQLYIVHHEITQTQQQVAVSNQSTWRERITRAFQKLHVTD